jgi:3-oxoacyl-[acyl-carrier protein] reductase
LRVDLGLNGRRALVTAASKGLGRACATALAQEGARVFINSRDEGQLATTAGEIGAAGHLAGDVSADRFAEQLVAAASESLGGLDILVCNAGGPPPGTFESTDLSAWQLGCQLTLMSTVRLIKAAMAGLYRSDQGRIVIITSISVRQPIGNLILSNAYRSAVTAMAKTFSFEAAAHGVTVNTMAPGTILTDRVRSLYGADVQSAAVNIPLGRIGEPKEFGAVCAFICSAQASYLTGQSIGVDGGALRGVH